MDVQRCDQVITGKNINCVLSGLSFHFNCVRLLSSLLVTFLYETALARLQIDAMSGSILYLLPRSYFDFTTLLFKQKYVYRLLQ